METGGGTMAAMRRRRIILAAPLVAAGAGTARAGEPPTLDQARHWLDQLERAKTVRTSGVWPIGTVLHHLAQSVEMSIEGYPEPKSALFQATAGSAAFAFFKWRARMSHNLAEPIPGAPALPPSADVPGGAARLRAALARFQQHQGALMPHFAYGKLDKADYARAHAMHIAEHSGEVRAEEVKPL